MTSVSSLRDRLEYFSCCIYIYIYVACIVSTLDDWAEQKYLEGRGRREVYDYGKPLPTERLVLSSIWAGAVALLFSRVFWQVSSGRSGCLLEMQIDSCVLENIGNQMGCEKTDELLVLFSLICSLSMAIGTFSSYRIMRRTTGMRSGPTCGRIR